MSHTPRCDDHENFGNRQENPHRSDWQDRYGEAMILARSLELELNAAPQRTPVVPDETESVAVAALDDDGLQLLRDARTALECCYEVDSYPANGKTLQDATIREIDDYLARTSSELGNFQCPRCRATWTGK